MKMEELKNVLHYIGGEEPKGKLAKELDEGVENVKKSEEWRRAYMTLLMRDREKIELGENKRLIKQIRTKFLREKPAIIIAEEVEIDVVYVENIISLIKEHPDWDDEDIASEIETNE